VKKQSRQKLAAKEWAQKTSSRPVVHRIPPPPDKLGRTGADDVRDVPVVDRTSRDRNVRDGRGGLT
jgi:hypothetical protein